MTKFGAIKREKGSLVKQIGKSPNEGETHTPTVKEEPHEGAVRRETKMNERTNGNDVIVLGLEKQLE